MSTTTPTPRIAIIGAGPVGLTLAAILHRNGINAAIFERETSATARAQGGTLDIHAETGQRALAAAGLLDEFRKVARPDADAARVVKRDGTVLLDENEEPSPPDMEEEGRGRPEVDRRALRDLLLKALPEGMVRWGRGIAAVEPVTGSKRWTLRFLDGGNGDGDNAQIKDDEGPYDLVLGADGTWSRVRSLLTDARPRYSGVTMLDVSISPPALEQRPDVKAFIGRGSCFMFDKDRALIFQRQGTGGARCYACLKTGVEVPGARALIDVDGAGADVRVQGDGDVEWTDDQTRTRFVDRHFSDYIPEAREALLAMTDTPVLRPLYMLPVGLRWDARPGVSLLGDAAHAMTPFAGVGVNVGMVDALELAEGIVRFVENDEGKRKGEADGGSEGDELARVLRTYEEGMFERSSRDAERTAMALDIQFREDGGETMVKIMSGGGPPA
ncbi:FAD/NAD(P)-binding domain-containing protein [Hypoxylon crocopeplum]|nr:FAD/NAD(P)-binding domain-containing protein [Hypoxylon crocopeplum]